MIAEIPIHANANMLPSLTFDPLLDYPPCGYQHLPLQNKCMYIPLSMSSGLIVILICSMFFLTFSPIAEYNESYYYVTDGALDESTEICYHDCDCENFTCYHTGELYIMASYPIHEKVFIHQHEP